MEERKSSITLHGKSEEDILQEYMQRTEPYRQIHHSKVNIDSLKLSFTLHQLSINNSINFDFGLVERVARAHQTRARTFKRFGGTLDKQWKIGRGK